MDFQGIWAIIVGLLGTKDAVIIGAIIAIAYVYHLIVGQLHKRELNTVRERQFERCRNCRETMHGKRYDKLLDVNNDNLEKTITSYMTSLTKFDATLQSVLSQSNKEHAEIMKEFSRLTEDVKERLSDVRTTIIEMRRTD
jgi:hypothetical protein